MFGKISRLDRAKMPQAGAHQKSASLNTARHLSSCDDDLALKIESLASLINGPKAANIRAQSGPESSSIGMLWQKNRTVGIGPMPSHLARPRPILLAKKGQEKHLNGIAFVAAGVQPRPSKLEPLRVSGKSYKRS